MSHSQDSYFRKLNLGINFEDQQKLIDYVLTHGVPAEVEAVSMPPFWIAASLRNCSKTINSKIEPEHQGRFSYLARGNLDLEWSWSTCAESTIVQNLLEQMAPSILKLTRVAIVLQIPGKAVPAHRDLIVGNQYDNLAKASLTIEGPNKIVYTGDDWDQQYDLPTNVLDHQKQNYFGLRIPLSARRHSNGRPFYQKLGQTMKCYYNAGGSSFLLNEASVKHGAEPVDFYRGVIIVDGMLDIKKLLTAHSA